MRPQHDDHGGRPSPHTQTPAEPDTLTDTATFRIGRVRQERPAGKPGQHRMASPGRAAKQAPPEPAAHRPSPAGQASANDPVPADQAKEAAGRFLTPAGPLTPGVGPVRALHRSAKAGRFAALSLIALLGISVVASQPTDPGKLDDASAQTLNDRADAPNTADRSANRATASPSASPQPSVQATTTPTPTATKPTTVKPTTVKPTTVKPVAGLDQAQMNNAQTIVQVGQKLGIPQRGLLIAVMTAMQESNLYNLASSALPESFDYPHQGEGMDYDSCGLFQQRTSTGWGTVKQIMTPTYAATKFYQALQGVYGWQGMELTLAAQAVQGSAYPYAYAKHESRARTILAALL
jgi:hypothetical protein